MKTHPFLILLITTAIMTAASGQEASNVEAKSVAIDPNSPDVQSSLTYDLGDRLLTIQEVTEKTLASPPTPLPSAMAQPIQKFGNSRNYASQG